MTGPTTGPHGPSRDLSATPTPRAEHVPESRRSGHGAPGGHRLMMLICCIPMVAIVVLLLVSGVAGPGVVLWALGCVALMAAMMLLMPGGHQRP